MKTEEAATALASGPLCCLTGMPEPCQIIDCVQWVRTLWGVRGACGTVRPTFSSTRFISPCPTLYNSLNRDQNYPSVRKKHKRNKSKEERLALVHGFRDVSAVVARKACQKELVAVVFMKKKQRVWGGARGVFNHCSTSATRTHFLKPLHHSK